MVLLAYDTSFVIAIVHGVGIVKVDGKANKMAEKTDIASLYLAPTANQ